MFISTRVVIDISTGVVLEREGFEYDGPVALAKGPSAEQKDLEKKQSAFYSTLTNNYNQQFSQQQQILNALGVSLNPIIQAGMNQYGFTPAEDTLIRTSANDSVASAYTGASKALSQKLAASGGGDAFIPSGSNDQLQAELANASAADQASKNLAITQAGFAQGRQNYLSAASILGKNAEIMNPNAYAGNANSAGTDAFSAATKIQEMQNAASPWGTIGGILGGAAGSFLGPIVGKVGSKVGGLLGGGGGGGFDYGAAVQATGGPG